MTTHTAPAHRPRLSPDKEQLKKYINRGLNQQQIADEWAKTSGNRVTRSAISMAMRQFNLDPANPRPRYRKALPWRVRVEHSKAYDAKMLRAKARMDLMKKKSDRLADPEYRRVQSWLADLKDLDHVIAYAPDTPQGFFWVPRLPTDAPEDVIRRPGLPGDVYHPSTAN